MQPGRLEHIYEFGDVYETIDTCDELQMRLSRLKRQGVIDHAEWLETKSGIEAIRLRLEGYIPARLA